MNEVLKDAAPKPDAFSRYRRPVVVVQCDAPNSSRIGTVVCVPPTTNIRWDRAPGNVRLSAAVTSLPRDSVANSSLMAALDQRARFQLLAADADVEVAGTLAPVLAGADG
jgi:mRNA interferase MazF